MKRSLLGDGGVKQADRYIVGQPTAHTVLLQWLFDGCCREYRPLLDLASSSNAIICHGGERGEREGSGGG